MKINFEKNYSVAIDTVPFPKEPAQRINIIMKSFGPVILEIIQDAMTIAIGTWPTPEKPKPY